jgi:Ser/Thr protein kinase RdoA (MazF antagonist)
MSMSLLEHTPNFSTGDAVQIARTLYGIGAGAESLPSERDQNFLLRLTNGEMRVLKIANALEERHLLEAKNEVMRHIIKRVSACPQLFQTLEGDLIGETTSGTGSRHFVRLISFLPGMPMGEVKRHSAELLYDLGRRVGEMDAALADFDHPAAHRELHWDLANALREIDRHKHLVADPELRNIVDSLASGFEQNVLSLLANLRCSVIQNDANDYNVIVGNNDTAYDDDLHMRNQQVIGLIDFGDLVYSYTVADLAIAIAYAILNKPDPLDAAVHIVRGYHANHPLTGDEITALFGLICMRLCVSVCMAAYQQQQRPDDAYLAISQAAIRNTLPRLAKIHPLLAEATFRHACGLPPRPHTAALRGWLQNHRDMFAPLLGINLQTEPALVFDLAPGSYLIQGDLDHISEPGLTRRLFGQMQAAGVSVGIGRYNEPRLIYTAPMFATGETLASERRTIHLGLDLFAVADTAVYAPLAGQVHACAINDNEQDYGGVIILRHAPPDGPLFYTLYGHLSHASVTELQVGQTVEKGEQFATLGMPAENGGWTPHLHFQIITDLLDLGCDFPGVAPVSQQEVWMAFSPDPNVIVGVPKKSVPAAGTRQSRNVSCSPAAHRAQPEFGVRDSA